MSDLEVGIGNYTKVKLQVTRKTYYEKRKKEKSLIHA